MTGTNDHHADSVEARKRLLRATMRARRLDVSEEQQRLCSYQMCERLLAWPSWARANCVAGYSPLPGEIDPGRALREVGEGGQIVAFPRITTLQPRLRFHRLRSPDDMVPGFFGLLEPSADSPEVPLPAIDIFIVPGLAFDRHGYRLGFGKGFYDEVARALDGDKTRSRRAMLVGAAYSFQLVDEVPVGPDDRGVDLIVTEAEVISCR